MRSRLSRFDTPSIQRHLLELATWGIKPDAEGLFTLADDVPGKLAEMVEDVCDKDDRYDYKMMRDI